MIQGPPPNHSYNGYYMNYPNNAQPQPPPPLTMTANPYNPSNHPMHHNHNMYIANQVALCYGDKIRLVDGREGFLKFIGTIGFSADEIWYGVVLRTPTGTCNGVHENRLFFECAPGYGLFVARHEIAQIISYSASTGQRFSFGQKVKCDKGVGCIKFVGELAEYNNIRTLLYGIELNKPIKGGNNGIYQNRVYFISKQFHGTFCAENEMVHFTKKKRKKKKSEKKKMRRKRPKSPRTPKSPHSPRAPRSPRAFHYQHTQKNEQLPIQYRTRSEPKKIPPPPPLPLTQKKNSSSLRTNTVPHNTHVSNGTPLAITTHESSSDSSPEQNEEDLQLALSSTTFNNILEKYKESNARKRRISKHTEHTRNDYEPMAPIIVPRSNPQNIHYSAKQHHNYHPKESNNRPQNHNRLNPNHTVHYKQTASLPNQHNFYTSLFQPAPHHNPHTPTPINSQYHHPLPEFSPINAYPPRNTQMLSLFNTNVPPPPPDAAAATAFAHNHHHNNNLNLNLNMINSSNTNRHQYAHSSMAALPPNELCAVVEQRQQPYLHQSESPLSTITQDIRAPPLRKNKHQESHTSVIVHQRTHSPFDVRSTREEFSAVADEVFLLYNNPRGLFKLLYSMSAKLKSSNAKYRILDPSNPAVQKKVFKRQDMKNNKNSAGPDAVKEWLRLLGFVCQPDTGLFICPHNQPSRSVIDNAQSVCKLWINKCNKSRKALLNIRKYSKHLNLHKEIRDSFRGRNIQLPPREDTNRKRSVIEDLVLAEGREEEESSSSTGTVKRKTTEMIEHEENEEEDEDDNDTKQQIVEHGGEDANTKGEQEEDEDEDDDDDEGENDLFKLQQLIWSVTHHKNTEHANVRDVLLLCHPVFTTPKQIMALLKIRFLEREEENTSYEHWEIQYRVTSFIQHWVRNYYYQDFYLNPTVEQLTEEFMDAMRTYFEEHNDTQRGCKLPNMIESTMEAQRKQLKEKGIDDEKDKRNSKLTKVLGLRMDKADQDVVRLESIKNKKATNRAAMKKFDKFYGTQNKKIAQQLVLISFNHFHGIKPRECLEQNWKGKEKEQRAPNILKVIQHFNAISNYIQITILNATNASKRGKWITKWLKIADILFELRDFQTLAAVHGALTSQTIYRQNIAWKKVPAKYRIKFEEFKVIYDSRGGHSNLRKIHNETPPPMVPYAGVLLQVLFQIDEGNKNKNEDGSVNFRKLMRLHAAIQRITLLQNTNYNKQIKTDAKLQEFVTQCMIKYAHVTSNEMYAKSTTALNKDDPKRLQTKK